jgi:hypothetical protein
MPSDTRFALFTAFVFSRKAAALATGTVVLIFLGCMCLNFGSQSSTDNADGVQTQDGAVVVPANGEVEVYYALPYGNIPNLSINDPLGLFIITEQKENHFRVRNKDGVARRAVWTARGQHVPAAVVNNPQPEGPPTGQPGPTQIGQPK